MDNLILFYDTETTGLPDWSQPSDAPQQPHLVQLGASLVDAETRKTVQSIDVIIQPNGWEIPEEVAKIHGITTEKAKAVGVSEELAVRMFVALWRNAHARCGHNESFDARIMRIAMKRYASALGEELADEWKAGKGLCTANMATPVLNLPPTDRMVAAGRTHAKTPTLSEAYKHFTGRELEGAHSAMVDVEACMCVYWHLQEQESAA